MIYGEAVTIGGGGQTASILATGQLTSADSCYATKGGKTYQGVWSTVQTPNPAWRGLPSGYTQLECINSSGTQAIDTGITYHAGINIETSYVNNGTDNLVFSANYILSGYYYRFNFYTEGNYIYGKNWVEISTTVSSGINTIKTNNAIITVNGTSYTHSGTNSGSGGSLTLFCYRDENGKYQAFSSISMYETIITDGNTIIADYIPCINQSNEVGFYDTVSETFKGRNVGSGNFTAGEAVPQYLTTQGFLIDKLKEYGTYTVTATQGTQSKTVDVMVDSAERFDIDIKFATYLVQNGTIVSGYNWVGVINTSSGTLSYYGGGARASSSSYRVRSATVNTSISLAQNKTSSIADGSEGYSCAYCTDYFIPQSYSKLKAEINYSATLSTSTWFNFFIYLTIDTLCNNTRQRTSALSSVESKINEGSWTTGTHEGTALLEIDLSNISNDFVVIIEQFTHAADISQTTVVPYNIWLE